MNLSPDEYMDQIAGQSQGDITANIIKKMSAHYADKPLDTIIDIGSGTGSVTASLPQFFKCTNVIGLDVDKTMVDHANQLEAKNVQFRTVNCQSRLEDFLVESVLSASSADMVLSLFAFMWFNEPEDALRNVSHVLKPGAHGHIIFAGWSRMENIVANIIYQSRFARDFRANELYDDVSISSLEMKTKLISKWHRLCKLAHLQVSSISVEQTKISYADVTMLFNVLTKLWVSANLIEDIPVVERSECVKDTVQKLAEMFCAEEFYDKNGITIKNGHFSSEFFMVSISVRKQTKKMSRVIA